MWEEHVTVIDDREWYMLEGAKRWSRFFFDRVFPWLTLAGIVFGIWYGLENCLLLIYELSEPLSKGLEVMGL